MAQDDQPAYDQRFYAAIIAKRREMGATGGYVDIDDCMRSMGREYSQTVKSDNDGENERA